MLSAGSIVLLCTVAFAAGFVDAIAGGGGLLTLPALLAAGLPPHVALGTNKGQAVWGSGSALLGFARLGLINYRTAPSRFLAGVGGALGGALLVSQIPPDRLRPVVLVLLLVVGIVLALRPPAPTEPRPDARAGGVVLLAAVIGAYDGFFGPGTGTFLIMAQVWGFGYGLVRASAEAKVVNFASNLAALGVFAASGAVDWRIALPMAAAQFLGGAAGSRAVIRGGDGLVRWAVLAVVTALVLKLGWDLAHSW